jgi:hypothetical protein
MYKAFIAKLFLSSHIAKTNCCMKKILVLLFFISFFCVKIIAQQFTVTGSVVDEYGRTLEGVSVKAKKSNALVQSGSDGQFSIQVQPKDVLLFSYPNYKIITTDVDDSSTIIFAKLTRIYFAQSDKVDVFYES